MSRSIFPEGNSLQIRQCRHKQKGAKIIIQAKISFELSGTMIVKSSLDETIRS